LTNLFRCVPEVPQGRRKRAIDSSADVKVEFEAAMDSTPDDSDELDVTGLQELVANATSQMTSIELQIANETSIGEVDGQVVLIPDTTTTTTLSPYASGKKALPDHLCTAYRVFNHTAYT